MYVCICHGVSERRIREAVAGSETTFEALQDSLGVSTCCGCCEEEVREILADSLEKQNQSKNKHAPVEGRTLQPVLR